jgi:hypothetical protein
MLFALTLGTVHAHAAEARNAPGSIHCHIDGVPHAFTVQAQAVESPEGRLQLLAFTEFRNKAAYLVLTLPALRLGAFSSRDSTNLTLSWSRSTYSSSMADYYDARPELPGTGVEVEIRKLGGIGHTVEGRFSGIAANASGSRVSLTNGTFTLVRRAPPPSR